MTDMNDSPGKSSLTHIDQKGQARMVDVSDKSVTTRQAIASAVVTLQPDALEALISDKLPKGDALAVVRIAAIQAAKRTSEWIPLCHSIPLSQVSLTVEPLGSNQLKLLCCATATAQTGVEMEALVGVSAAALTLYDMVKAMDKGVVIGPIQLESKSGGRSGTYQRDNEGE